MPLLAGAVFVMVMSEALIVAPKMLRPSTVYDSFGLSKTTGSPAVATADMAPRTASETRDFMYMQILL